MRRSHSNLHDIVDNLRFGSEKYFQTFIEKKGDLNLSDGFGRTLLMWSVLDGKIDRVKALIDAGCMMNLGDKNKNTALMHAIQSSNVNIAQILVLHGAGVNHCNEANSTSLMTSVEQENLQLVQLLLLHGADSNHVCGHRYLHNIRTALTWAIENELHDITGAILSARQTVISYHLTVCIQSHNIRTFQFLLAHGANAFYGDMEKSCGEKVIRDYLNGHSNSVKILESMFIEHGFCTSILKKNDIVNCLYLNENQPNKTEAKDKKIQTILKHLLNLGMIPETSIVSKLQGSEEETSSKTTFCVPELQKLARTAIREAMRFGISVKVEKLPIPRKLKIFLALKGAKFL